MKGQISLFIVGLPRSGTKLLRELLNNHSNIFMPSIEAFFIPHIINKYHNKKLNLTEATEVVKEIKNSVFFFYYLKENTFDFDKFIEEDVTCKDIINNIWFEIAYQQGKGDAEILGDKTPRNIAHIALLLEEYPEAKIIHIVRDPRDNAISAKNKWNKHIFRTAYKWQQAISKVIDLNPDKSRFMELKYEDMISNPEKELRNICSFLNIDYEKEMHELRLKLDIGDKIDRTNYNKYLKEMKESDIRYIEQLTQPGMQHYGYQFYSKDVRFIQNPNKYRLLFWKYQDWANLLKFRFKENGFAKGIKFIKASKRHA